MKNKPEVDNMQTTSLAPATEKGLAPMAPLEISMYKMEITAEQIRQYIAPQDATSADIGFFLAMSKSLGLNPFASEVYMIPFKGKTGRKYAAVVSYQVLLDRADASGVLDGIEIEFDNDDDPQKCTVTIYRKDWSHPFKRTTLLSEVIRTYDGKPMALWKTRLRQMFEKCAVTAALRFSIPACRRMPYIEEELGNGVVMPELPAQPAPLQPEIETVEQVPTEVHADRKTYFGVASKFFKNDEDRHQWQKTVIGKESTKDWSSTDFGAAYDVLLNMIQNAEPEPETDQGNAPEPEQELDLGPPKEPEEKPKPKPKPAKPPAPKPPKKEKPTASNGEANLDSIAESLAEKIGTDKERLLQYTATKFKTPAQATLALNRALNDKIIFDDLKPKFEMWDAKAAPAGEEVGM